MHHASSKIPSRFIDKINHCGVISARKGDASQAKLSQHHLLVR